MFQICCTAKLFHELGLNATKLPQHSVTPEPLKVWYAHLFRLDRRKCLALINPPTGYVLYVFNVKKNDIVRLPQLLRERIRSNFEQDGVSSDLIDEVTADEEWQYCRTNDKSALARLNVVIREAAFYAKRFRGQRGVDEKAAAVVNHGPTIDGRFAITTLATLIGEPLKNDYRVPGAPGDYDGPILQIKITLLGITPAIWRTVRVPGSFDLHRFHLTIQGAMGWENRHHHQFSSAHGCFEDRKVDHEADCQEERQVTVSELFASRNIAHYLYDFCDDWRHRLVLEGLSLGPETGLPRCVAGGGNCPPEDCGGILGFRKIVEILKGNSIDRRAELRDWLGSYDPSAFSVDEASKRMFSASR